MKEIIYLDTSFLNSFIAQTNNGLPTNHVRELLEQETNTSIDATQRESSHEASGKASTGSISIPAVFSTPSGELNYKYNIKSKIDSSVSLSQLDAGKEIISKQLHDNALLDFESYLEENHRYCTNLNFEAKQLGEFIKITHPFDIFDINYIRNLYKVDLLTELMTLNQIPPAHVKDKSKWKPRLEPGVEMGMKGFDLLFRYLSNIIPSSLCIKQGKFFSPLKEEYIRGNNSDIIFKYGTQSSLKITVIGKTTRIFDQFDIDMFSENGDLSKASIAINVFFQEVLDQIRLIKKGDIIVSPIAIYFE